MPKVSVIITCYNLGTYLEEAILSIRAYPQRDDYEIILVDDGSNDGQTKPIIQQILDNHPEVLLLDQPNLGLAKARNNGIRMAKGKYIIPLDADNKIRPVFISKTIELLQDESFGVLHGDAQLFGNKSDVWKGKPFDLSEMVLNNYIDACASFRKSDWEAMGGYDENMPVMGFEDWDLWLRMAVKGYQFHYIPEILFDYRVRDHSMLADAWSKRQRLLDYIFNKKELQHLAVLRRCLVENQKLRRELSVKQLFGLLLLKIRKKIKK